MAEVVFDPSFPYEVFDNYGQAAIQIPGDGTDETNAPGGLDFMHVVMVAPDDDRWSDARRAARENYLDDVNERIAWVLGLTRSGFERIRIREES